jgi:DNA repair protein RadC
MKQSLLKELNKVYERNEGPEIRGPSDVYNQLKDIKDADREILIQFNLDTKNRIISRDIILIGILDRLLVHPRSIFRSAIINNAKSIIIAHNHPSGDPTPSKEDIRFTKRIYEAGELLGIELLDSIVVGKNNFEKIEITKNEK